MKTEIGQNTLVFACIGVSAVALAQPPQCRRIAATAEMSRAASMTALRNAEHRAGDDYRARLVLAYRGFQLRPQLKSNAERLLGLIPQNEAEENAVMTLGDSLCDGERVADMKSLSRVAAGLALELSRSVILAPKFLPAYVEYSLESTADPHSDYAVQMSGICKRKHSEFLRAVNGLPQDKRSRFKKYVMNPDSCAAIAMPEAE